MERSEGAEGPAQHLADAMAAAFARTEQPGEHLAVHAPKLAIEPRLQILQRHRRSLLLRLEHPYCSAVEDHVNRAPGVGLHRSFNLRIGISPGNAAWANIRSELDETFASKSVEVKPQAVLQTDSHSRSRHPISVPFVSENTCWNYFAAVGGETIRSLCLLGAWASGYSCAQY